MEEEAEKTNMGEKCKAYCHDYEVMKPVLDVLAKCDDETRVMVHQLVHTMFDNGQASCLPFSITIAQKLTAPSRHRLRIRPLY